MNEEIIEKFINERIKKAYLEEKYMKLENFKTKYEIDSIGFNYQTFLENKYTFAYVMFCYNKTYHEALDKYEKNRTKENEKILFEIEKDAINDAINFWEAAKNYYNLDEKEIMNYSSNKVKKL